MRSLAKICVVQMTFSFIVQSTFALSSQLQSRWNIDYRQTTKYCRHSWKFFASFDNFYLKFKIHIFCLEWTFCRNFVCLHDIALPNLETLDVVTSKFCGINSSIGYKLVKQWFFTLKRCHTCQESFIFSFNWKDFWGFFVEA